jgi:hypothetical protein
LILEASNILLRLSRHLAAPEAVSEADFFTILKTEYVYITIVDYNYFAWVKAE